MEGFRTITYCCLEGIQTITSYCPEPLIITQPKHNPTDWTTLWHFWGRTKWGFEGVVEYNFNPITKHKIFSRSFK